MDRGRLLFEYRPPRAHPIFYAGIIVFAFVLLTGSLEVLARDADRTLIAWYALPLVATAWIMSLLAPSPTRIYEAGIEPSRSATMRWWRPFIRWDELAAVYPAFYDVTGAFVSPFASSDGKVTQMGLALEWPSGQKETVRFTPTRFTMWQAKSAGYTGALEAVRYAFDERPLVAEAETFTPQEAQRMMEEASKPFLPFFAIVLLFASAAPVLWVLTRIGMPVLPAMLIALIAPVAVSLRSYIQSQRRHEVLDRLSKAAEYKRGLRPPDGGDESE